MARVLALTNWYPPHHLGGYELLCHDAMTGLEARGHDVLVLCGDSMLDDAEAPRHDDHEARVWRELRLYVDERREPADPPWGTRLAVERHNQRTLARAIAEHRPDVVSVWHLAAVSHGLLTTVARAGIPAVFVVYDDWLVFGIHQDPWARNFRGSPWRRAAGRAIEWTTGIPCSLPDVGAMGSFLFTTAATEAKALAESSWAPGVRTRIWGGVDRERFHPGEHRPWSWRLVVTGRFDPRKGFETVVRALALLPDEATLALYGRGGAAERGRLAALADSLGVTDRVHFGALEREELADAYRAADVVVFPSEWAEPFGLVPLEAMACGTPVVATGVGGSGEYLVDETNCLLFPPGDDRALADRIRRLAGDAAARARLVAGGERTASELCIERLRDVIEEWHRWEADGRPGPRPADRPAPGAATPGP